ncbi:MAG TPA: hypothetical protein VG843_13610 [Rhizomicrobium sp.]|nr:hypothetical protein [Rhizomicrobium sp.]
MRAKIVTAAQRRKADRARAKRAALRALKRARKAADAADVSLSPWEGEFLGSVESRVERYGRAFRDPDKGPPDSALSMLQAQKLREIAGKAKGRKTGLGGRPQGRNW